MKCYCYLQLTAMKRYNIVQIWRVILMWDIMFNFEATILEKVFKHFTLKIVNCANPYHPVQCWELPILSACQSVPTVIDGESGRMKWKWSCLLVENVHIIFSNTKFLWVTSSYDIKQKLIDDILSPFSGRFNPFQLGISYYIECFDVTKIYLGANDLLSNATMDQIVVFLN